jgi:SAM-dependent methyltransferase
MPSGCGDGWAEIYERGRPGWPTEAVHVAGVPSTATVLDLGAGTGKLTRILATEFERVVAAEPSEPMRRLRSLPRWAGLQISLTPTGSRSSTR